MPQVFPALFTSNNLEHSLQLITQANFSPAIIQKHKADSNYDLR